MQTFCGIYLILIFFFFSLYIYIFFLFFMFLFVVVLGGSLVLSLSNLYSSLFSSSLSTFIFPSDLGSNLIVLCRKLTAFSSSFLSLLFISDFLKIFTIYTNNSQYITISIRMKLKLKLQKLQTINQICLFVFDCFNDIVIRACTIIDKAKQCSRLKYVYKI